MEKKYTPKGANGYLFSIKDFNSFSPVCKVDTEDEYSLSERLCLCIAQVDSVPFFVKAETLSDALDSTPLKVVDALGKLRRNKRIQYTYLKAVNLYAIESVTPIESGCSCPFGFASCEVCLFLRGCRSGACSIQREVSK